ncbi:hypothetical protein AB9M93_05255 [Peribacillus frigoritolerans]|jgi:hypothetical protein
MAIETPPHWAYLPFGGVVLYAMNGSSLTSAATFNLVIDVQSLTLFSG